MEFQEALMRLMINSPTSEKTLFGKDSDKQRAANAKHKWKIPFYKSSPINTESKPPQQQPPEPPKEFLCPISGSLMNDPVIVSSGHTFERACVQACKTLCFTPTVADGTSPDFSNVIPNLALKSTILKWCQNHSLNPPKPLDFFSAENLVRTFMATAQQQNRKANNTNLKTESRNEVSSEEKLILGVKENPSVKLNHAASEITRRRSHFHSNSDESIASSIVSTPPLQLTTRPSCYSSSNSSSETEILDGNTNPNTGEEQDLITKLRSPQVFEVEEAVISLRKLTRSREETRVGLCTPRLLSVVRSLIISRYTTIQVNSVAALVNLSLEKSNKVKIVRSGIIPPLIDVLKSGSPEAQEHAAGAVFSLALEDNNKTAIGVLGALPPLLHLLRSESERTRHDSALALYHLSLVQSNKSKLIKLGSVPVLLNMVKSGHMSSRILLVLGNMASCRDGRAALLDSGGVECLVGILKGSELDEPTREGCVAVLYGLSHGGLRFKGLAKSAGAADALQKVVEKGRSERGKEKARRMLEIMKARAEEEEEEMVDWEKLLDSGLLSRTRHRIGAKDGSRVNSS